MGQKRAVLIVLITMSGCGAVPPNTPATPTAGPPSTSSITDEIRVDGPDALRRALAEAQPGQTITLADGAYSGKPPRGNDSSEPGRYVIARSGTPDAPITLRGSRAAVLDGDGTDGGYVLHLVNADYWRLEGFTATSGSKGIVLDGSSHNVMDGVRVTDIGDEGVHFRAFSSRNTIQRSEVDHTGMDSEGFGEGVYLGSANSNWGRYSGGQPDRSDQNQVLDNRITDTRAEPIDVKEGTTGGVITGNVLGGDGVAGQNSADSFLDVKGNGYRIEGNHGTHTAAPIDPDDCNQRRRGPFCHGFEVHRFDGHGAMDGWGRDNVFRSNRLEVNAPGAGIWLQNNALEAGNVIGCDNEVIGAAAGDYATNHYSSIPCTR
jgi:hypothetical protein